MFLLLYHNCGLHLFQRRVLVPIDYWRLRLMLQNLQGLSKLAGPKTNRTRNLLPFPTGSPRIFSIRNGRDQEKDRKEVPLILTAPFHCCIIDPLFFNEQSDVTRRHDLGRTRHEWYFNRRMQGLSRNCLRKKGSKRHTLRFVAHGVDFLQNFSLPILSVGQRVG